MFPQGDAKRKRQPSCGSVLVRREKTTSKISPPVPGSEGQARLASTIGCVMYDVTDKSVWMITCASPLSRPSRQVQKPVKRYELENHPVASHDFDNQLTASRDLANQTVASNAIGDPLGESYDLIDERLNSNKPVDERVQQDNLVNQPVQSHDLFSEVVTASSKSDPCLVGNKYWAAQDWLALDRVDKSMDVAVFPLHRSTEYLGLYSTHIPPLNQVPQVYIGQDHYLLHRKVCKTGAGSGFTQGIIRAADITHMADGRTYTGVFAVAGLSGKFATQQDIGAAVVDQYSCEVVGLVCAVSRLWLPGCGGWCEDAALCVRMDLALLYVKYKWGIQLSLDMETDAKLHLLTLTPSVSYEDIERRLRQSQEMLTNMEKRYKVKHERRQKELMSLKEGVMECTRIQRRNQEMLKRVVSELSDRLFKQKHNGRRLNYNHKLPQVMPCDAAMIYPTPNSRELEEESQWMSSPLNPASNGVALEEIQSCTSSPLNPTPTAGTLEELSRTSSPVNPLVRAESIPDDASSAGTDELLFHGAITFVGMDNLQLLQTNNSTEMEDLPLCGMDNFSLSSDISDVMSSSASILSDTFENPEKQPFINLDRSAQQRLVDKYSSLPNDGNTAVTEQESNDVIGDRFTNESRKYQTAKGERQRITDSSNSLDVQSPETMTPKKLYPGTVGKMKKDQLVSQNFNEESQLDVCDNKEQEDRIQETKNGSTISNGSVECNETEQANRIKLQCDPREQTEPVRDLVQENANFIGKSGQDDAEFGDVLFDISNAAEVATPVYNGEDTLSLDNMDLSIEDASTVSVCNGQDTLEDVESGIGESVSDARTASMWSSSFDSGGCLSSLSSTPLSQSPRTDPEFCNSEDQTGEWIPGYNVQLTETSEDVDLHNGHNRESPELTSSRPTTPTNRLPSEDVSGDTNDVRIQLRSRRSHDHNVHIHVYSTHSTGQSVKQDEKESGTATDGDKAESMMAHSPAGEQHNYTLPKWCGRITVLLFCVFFAVMCTCLYFW